MTTQTQPETRATLQTLPGDHVRQIMWRYADRYDVQMVVQSSRAVARGVVAQLVAQGERNTHHWTERKNSMFPAFDEAGVTTAGLDLGLRRVYRGPAQPGARADCIRAGLGGCRCRHQQPRTTWP